MLLFEGIGLFASLLRVNIYLRVFLVHRLCAPGTRTRYSELVISYFTKFEAPEIPGTLFGDILVSGVFRDLLWSGAIFEGTGYRVRWF